jgi:tetratricopeptide (TPR) repeat protein
MSDEKRDPYEVLGVPRDADPRTVKAAYFALVREFPPETHPAEFQELRDAYEVLSDPDRREQLDASHDAVAGLGAEEAALLQEAHHAFARDDVEGGLTMLRRLIEDHPDLLVAREQLGIAYLRTRAFPDAAQVWTALTHREPKNASYHLHLGYARHGCDQAQAATESFRTALELGAGDEARVALADALADAGDWMNGVRVLDAGIEAAGDKPPPPLVRKKVALLLLHGQARKAWSAFDHLVEVLGRHEQDRAAHADGLASLAAWIFAKGKEKLANQLLRRLSRLDPGRKPDRVFPSKATIHTTDLPPESIDWLAGKVEQPRRFVRSQSKRFWAFVALVPGALLFWWAVSRATSEARWDRGDLFWTGILYLLAALALAFGGGRFHAALTATLPKMTLLHPVYYLKVDYDRVHAYPLVNLHDVKVVRHSTNGVYTHTQVHLPFGGRKVQVRFRNTDEAGQFADALLARRRRMLELQANGLVETEPGIDLIPAALLAGGAGRRPRWPFVAGGAVLAAALGTAVAAHFNARAVEAREWAEARERGTPTALRDFLTLHPERTERVRAALDAWVTGLEAGPEALPPGPGRARALAVVHALAAGAPREVAVTLSWPDESAGKEVDTVRCTFPPQLRDLLRPALQASFDRALGQGMVRVVPSATPRAISLDLSVSTGALATYRATGATLPPLRTAALDWALTLRLPGAAPDELRGTAPPPPALDLPAADRRATAPAPAPAPVKVRAQRGPTLVPLPPPDEFLRMQRRHPRMRIVKGPNGALMLALGDEVAEPRPPAEETAPGDPAERTPAQACDALVTAQLTGLAEALARELGLSAKGRGVLP